MIYDALAPFNASKKCAIYVTMKRHQNPQQTLKLILIASALMIIADYLFVPMKIKPPSARQNTIILPESIYEHSEIADYNNSLSRLTIDIPQPDPIPNTIDKMITNPADLNIQKQIKPAPLKYPNIPGKGRVAIIIDDMGMNRKNSFEVIELPKPLTLAFLPYAPKLQEITKQAKKAGHELLVHVPMQPIDRSIDPGPMELRDDMSAHSFETSLEKNMAAFDGYVGINNHMGSKLTQDQQSMDRIMNYLKVHDLIFIDSVTTPHSVAANSAAAHGLEYNQRDVFLDHEDNDAYVQQALYEIEKIAKRRGYAIAIGHPKETTIRQLEAWIPTLKDKGLTLVPVSMLTKKAAAPENVSLENFGPTQQPAPPP